MALMCPGCRSDLVQVGVKDVIHCMSCGRQYNSKGEQVNLPKDDEATPTGPPPEEDPSGKYDHTGPYPTPVHPTPPNPDRADLRTQADLDAVGKTVDAGVETQDEDESTKKAKSKS